jgi:hypothetical protein
MARCKSSTLKPSRECGTHHAQTVVSNYSFKLQFGGRLEYICVFVVKVRQCVFVLFRFVSLKIVVCVCVCVEQQAM